MNNTSTGGYIHFLTLIIDIKVALAEEDRPKKDISK